jgi:DNA repair protein RecN (Recombination protein N)
VHQHLALATEREMLMHQEQIISAFNEALALVEGDDVAPGVLDRLRSAQARLDRVADKAGGGLQPALEALDRAMIETEEAITGLQAFGSRLETEPDRLERVDDRLYALRSAARKHGVAVDELAALAERMRTELAEVEEQGEALARLEADVARSRAAFVAACRVLTDRRQEAAETLARRVMAELPALKLERAVFTVALDPRDEDHWGADGAEEVRFMAATNPGSPAGPINRIASGGELSRFMLALSVVLASASPVRTLVFDELDSGVGGATAAAVGERLAALARSVQVLVVTHSPQVAARGDHHWRVLKREVGGRMTTTVEVLEGEARLEEVARMLSGAEITAEARGAAARLLEAAA